MHIGGGTTKTGQVFLGWTINFSGRFRVNQKSIPPEIIFYSSALCYKPIWPDLPKVASATPALRIYDIAGSC